MSLFGLFRKDVPESATNTEESGLMDNSFFIQKQPKLPQNFAQNIMDLEMRLQFVESYDIEAVKKLNELYKVGIQYFIHNDSKKANHFQRKLTTLLTNPQTLQLIDQDSKKNQFDSPDNHAIQYGKNLKMQMNKWNAQSEMVVKSMIEGSEKKNQRKNRMIDENITQQQMKLRRRIQKRSRSKSSKREKFIIKSDQEIQ